MTHPHAGRLTLAALLLLPAAPGCDRTQPAEQNPATKPTAAATSAPADPAPKEPTAAADETRLMTSEGTYAVFYEPAPDPIPLNELLTFKVRVETEDGIVSEDVSLAVDAAMPGHGHGMNTVPEVHQLGAGLFIAEGLLLHMAGRWEVYFDVTRDGITERAQFELDLE